jgi:hypothetical protein
MPDKVQNTNEGQQGSESSESQNQQGTSNSTWVTVNTSNSVEMQRMEIQKGEDIGNLSHKESE